jgi:hypothetical protein
MQVRPAAHTEAYLSTMEVRVLGPLEVLVDSAPIPLGGIKQRTVLALLAASTDQTVAANALILGVYGDEARRQHYEPSTHTCPTCVTRSEI